MENVVLKGKVVEGNGIGRKLGYPTINVSGNHNIGFGVYESVVLFGEKRYKGALHYGPRAVLGEDKPVLEIHLLDFDGNLYGETVQIEVYNKLREVESFKDFESLKEQISKDINKVKNAQIY